MTLQGNPVNALIQKCLLEERLGESSYLYKSEGVSYTLKWTMHNVSIPGSRHQWNGGRQH